MIRPLPEDRGPRPVRESIEAVSTALGLPASLLRAWPELVGEGIAAHASPRRLHDGSLLVEVDDPAWATQLRWLEADLVARLATLPGGPRVRSIDVRVARG